jgi:outer membrane protein OmpA-like peptidoglycan-associated protein
MVAMNSWVTTHVHKGIPIALACLVALLSGGSAALAEDQPTEEQIREQLLSKVPRAAQPPAADREQGREEREILERLAKKIPRTITPDERRKIEPIVSRKPSIDLEVTFEYDSAVIGPNAVPTLVRLGRALGSPDLKGEIFVIAGHTDAAGTDSYNQSLSERRAEAVKIFLTQQFNFSPDQLVAIGYGRSQLKNAANPLAAENRRVKIVNTEQPATVSQK